MQFLKTIFWAILAVVGAIFAVKNWTLVTISLWDGIALDTRLPVLLLITFLIGLLPTFLLHRATRWSLKRKLDTAERALADIRSPAVPAAASQTLPPAAAPMAAPPGVA